MHKELGKISNVRLGKGGYDDAMFGFTFQLSCCADFWGTWSFHLGSFESVSDEEKWKKGQEECFLDSIKRVKFLMEQAKVSDFQELIGKPVEITFDSPNGKMVTWRILREVL